MFELTGQKIAADFRKAVFILDFRKHILACFPVVQALMRVHPAARKIPARTWHEGTVQAVMLGDRFQGHPRRQNLICRNQSVVVSEIDLVLAEPIS